MSSSPTHSTELSRLLSSVGIDGTTIIGGTVCSALLFAIMSALPVSMIAVGSYYYHDCPAQKMIPNYLVVVGVLSLLFTMMRLLRLCVEANDGDERSRCCADALMSVALLAWFIAGCKWVFPIYTPNFSNPTSVEFCSPVVYYFAFVMLCLTAAGLCLGFVVGICVICCICCFGDSN